jgi:collagenase-like PrtC family protease
VEVGRKLFEITATVENIAQAEKLIDAGVDTLYFGENEFGLRLGTSFTREEIRELTELAHKNNKQVAIAVNAIMHPDKMEKIPEYLDFLQSIQVDKLVVGDPGVIYLLTKDDRYSLPYIYDGETLVTSAGQINFWASHEAIGAVVAREVPFAELEEMSNHLNVYGEILVYGATAIHQSKRPLLSNYFNFIVKDDDTSKNRDLFLAEPKEKDTHYSIYEDSHGTHIFANNDIDLMLELQKLNDAKFTHWKLEGLYTPGDNFVEIAKLFVQARELIKENRFDITQATLLDEQVRALHPENRGLDEGFFGMNPEDIK